MTVVVDEGGTDETAEVVEAVADAVADVAEAVADAVADAVDDTGSGQTVGEEIDRWVDLESRLGGIESRLDDIAMRPSVSYEDVERIAREVAAPVAEVVAEETIADVVAEVADEDGTGDAGEEITIVAPDVAEEPRQESFFRRIW